MTGIFSNYNLELGMFFKLQVGFEFKAFYVEMFYIGMHTFSKQMGKGVLLYYEKNSRHANRQL